MRRAVQERTTSFVVLKPATAAIIVAFVAALCVLSFAVGTTQADGSSQIPVVSVASSDAAVKPQITADNVQASTDAEYPESIEAAPVVQEERQSETEPADLSSATQAPTDDSEAQSEWQTVKMRVTAYCPCPKCCGEYSDGITACGHKIKPGDTFVAADGRFAFYTDMVIEGYGSSQPVQVLDRGGAIKGNKLDVFFMTHQEALEWGVRHIDVKVRYKTAS